MHQVVEMTHAEKIEMYRAVDKEKLIEMLIEANNVLERLTKPFSYYYGKQNKND